MAATLATKEAIWLKTLLSELGTTTGDGDGITLMSDNQGSIALAKNPVHHQRTKHIDVRFHFIRDQVLARVIKLVYCQTSSMVADICTKALSRDKFEKFREMMGMQVGIC